jgi:putative endonuclease
MARRTKPDAVRAATPERLTESREVASRQVAFKFGISAESRAAAYLIAKGYRIVARRWRCPAGEIDIVAKRRGVLIFVEVKAREKLDAAAEAVVVRQQRRIIAAAAVWLANHPDFGDVDIRFDVVLVAPKSLPRHIMAAFDASL